jgi:hypothetical protein
VSPSKEPIKPPEEGGGEPWVTRPARPEINIRPGDLEAELDRYHAGTEQARMETELRELEVKMSIDLSREKSLVDLRIREKETDARIRDEERRADSERKNNAARAIADVNKAEAEANKTAAEVERIKTETTGIERRNRATEIERYVFTGLAVIGVLATIILAFITAGHSIAPLSGLAISAGSGVRLAVLARQPSRGDQDDKPGDREDSGEGRGLGGSGA